MLKIRFNDVSIINVSVTPLQVWQQGHCRCSMLPCCLPQMIMATGLSVDYSVYLAQKYMTVKVRGVSP